ncbi:FadR/GntR family transcriptional regulator [Desulfitobacterium hafniense]|uniref:FadR/GntR family transcriptional regulator n=1 Tax=Desulfitobacterium hafniense TaxID=49338 RepID=UPI00036E29BF|nr:FadR/GntR family transcriptional regulator [Desulfitobacterium hafniense]
MSIQKASRSTLVGQVTAQLEHMIESGQWQIGEKIPAEPELMDRFDVSRNTLREGIQALVHVGLLETRQGIGTTVKANSNFALALAKKVQKSNLYETLEVRLGLEREAAQLAAGKRTAEDLQHMEACLELCKEAAQSHELGRFIEADTAFHKSVVKATHNTMFIEMYEHITDALQRSVDEVLRIRNPINYENEIHTNLFQAIQAGDSQLALDSVNHYLEDAKKSLSHLINE